ncbi:MAG: DoxX family protein [Candidatus Woesearchaeota archaeon]
MELQKLGLPVLRLGLGFLFLINGIIALLNQEIVLQMLNDLKFPYPNFWIWVLILIEVIGGILLLIGYMVKHATAPLMTLVLVVILTIQIPGTIAGNPAQLLKDIAIFCGLFCLFALGPGSYSIEEELEFLNKEKGKK